MYNIYISPKKDASIGCSQNKVCVAKTGLNEKEVSITLRDPAEAKLVEEVLTHKQKINKYKSLCSELGLFSRSSFIKVVNYMFASSLLDVQVIDEEGICNCRVQGNSYTARLLSLKKESRTLQLELMNISYYNDEWQLENSISKILIRWDKQGGAITSYITEVMEGRDKWKEEWKNEILNLMALNIENEVNGQIAKSLWTRHDINFNKMTRHHDDLTDRTGSYRFGTTNIWLNQVDLNDALAPLQYHIKRGLPPYSQRIPTSECAQIHTQELLELFNRAFANIKPREIADNWHNEKYSFDIIHRPYPSAGGIYEQKFYLLQTENKNNKSSEKVMQYSCSRRAFVRQEGNEKLEELITSYLRRCWMSKEPPAYILLMTGIYPALSYKYNNIAYRLMLLNAGCALSSFYEACRSLNIGCCPGGTGPTKAITRLLGVDEHIETPVIEVGFGKHQ